MTAGKVSDLESRVLVDADGQEPLQLGPSRVEHAERCVTGAGQLARHRQHALKDRLELWLLEHAMTELDQRAKCAFVQGP